MKKLYRSSTNKYLGGVFGGLGEHFEIDPTILRLVYVLITIMSGFLPALVAYVIAYLIVPEKPHHHTAEATYTEKSKVAGDEAGDAEPAGEVKKEEEKKEAPVPEHPKNQSEARYGTGSSVRGSSSDEKEEIKTENKTLL